MPKPKEPLHQYLSLDLCLTCKRFQPLYLNICTDCRMQVLLNPRSHPMPATTFVAVRRNLIYLLTSDLIYIFDAQLYKKP